MPAVDAELTGDFESILKTVSEINCEDSEDQASDKGMSCGTQKDRRGSCALTKSCAKGNSSEFYAVAIKLIAKILGIIFNMSLLLFDNARQRIGNQVLFLYEELTDPSCPDPDTSANMMTKAWFGLQLAFFASSYVLVFVIVAILKLMLFEIPI